MKTFEEEWNFFDGQVFGGKGGGVYMGGGAYIQDVNWVTYLKGIYIFFGGGEGGAYVL